MDFTFEEELNTRTYKILSALMALFSALFLAGVIRDVMSDSIRVSELLKTIATGFLALVAFANAKLKEKAKQERIETKEEESPAPKEIYKRIAWIGAAHIAIVCLLMIIASWRND